MPPIWPAIRLPQSKDGSTKSWCSITGSGLSKHLTEDLINWLNYHPGSKIQLFDTKLIIAKFSLSSYAMLSRPAYMFHVSPFHLQICFQLAFFYSVILLDMVFLVLSEWDKIFYFVGAYTISRKFCPKQRKSGATEGVQNSGNLDIENFLVFPPTRPITNKALKSSFFPWDEISSSNKKFLPLTRNFFLWQEISSCVKKFLPVTRNIFL